MSKRKRKRRDLRDPPIVLQGFLDCAQSGDYRGAVRILLTRGPLMVVNAELMLERMTDDEARETCDKLIAFAKVVAVMNDPIVQEALK